MTSAFLEIVELGNGDVVLRRADGKGEPLVRISFSDESKTYMAHARVEIAKAMLHTGIQTYAQLAETAAVAEREINNETVDEQARVLH